MLRFFAVAGLVVGAFLVGRCHEPSPAKAAVFQPCQKYECINTHSWWDGNGAVTVKAVYWAVGGGATIVDRLDHFNLFSTWKPTVPPVFGLGTFEFDHPACTPHCPRVGPKWLAPQIVDKAGPPGPPPPIAIPQTQCTHNGYQADGITPIQSPPAADQDNQANPGTPPGVPADTPAD